MIRFTYKLGGVGWASATLTDGQSDVTFPASYLCDALRDLVDGVQSLFVTDNAQVRWEEEPGAVLWDFRRSDSRLIVKVRWHDDRESFEGDEDLLHFGSEVDRQLDALLASWGADGYMKQWRYSFPQEAHDKLKRALKAERERRKATTQYE